MHIYILFLERSNQNGSGNSFFGFGEKTINVIKQLAVYDFFLSKYVFSFAQLIMKIPSENNLYI